MVCINQKRSFLLKKFKTIIENREFDEIDIIAFLIAVRSLVEQEKGTYQYIWEVSCFVAHPDRDTGFTVKGFWEARENGYKTKQGTNIIDKHNGIKNVKWYKEWKELGTNIGICFNDEIIKEITICIMSILQGATLIHNAQIIGHLKIVQAKDSILLCTTEGLQESVYIGFLIISGVQPTGQIRNGEICEAVYAVRDNDVLHLITESNDYVI